MPWGPHWHHQLTDSSGKTIEIFCSSDNMYLHIVHVSYVGQIMTFCMYMYMYLFIVVSILTEVSMELLREWWILRGQDAGACQYVLQTNAGKTFGSIYWISNLTDRRIYYMIEMALGPLLLVNMLISKTEIRGYLGMSVSERSVFLHRLPGGWGTVQTLCPERSSVHPLHQPHPAIRRCPGTQNTISCPRYFVHFELL